MKYASEQPTSIKYPSIVIPILFQFPSYLSNVFCQREFGMKKSQSNLLIQRFVSTTGKNQYLLTSAGEAAVIDVSESYDEICKVLDNMEIGLKYLLVTHAHKLHLKALPELKKKIWRDFLPSRVRI